MADNVPTAPAPAASAAPAVPKMDLSHEPPAVAKIMQSPEYWSGNKAVRQRAADAVFQARMAGNLPPVVDESKQTTLGRTEGFAPPSNDSVPVDAPSSNIAQTAFPSEMPTGVARSFQGLAVEVGIGSRELASIAKESLPYLDDNTAYTYESGEQALRQQLGEKATGALRDAKAFVKEFPEVLRVLEQRKLANHPGVIRVLAARWNARDGLQKKAGAARSNPQFFGPKSGQGNVDHAEARRLADEVAALMEELHS